MRLVTLVRSIYKVVHVKILMFTNTFTPRLGGVTQSVVSLQQELTKRGHSTLIVTAHSQSEVLSEPDVLRVPVLAHTNGADWPLPVMPKRARQEIEAFAPDIIHTHHPFLLGRTALHAAARFDVPIVYTFHTRYDLYLRASGGGVLLEQLIRRSMLAFCQTADAVIAPSDTIRCMLQASGLLTPVVTIPSGIDAARVSGGDRRRMRIALGIRSDAFVIGYIGRLEAEKNLDFLASAAAIFLRKSPEAIFLVGGNGTQQRAMMEKLSDAGVGNQVVFAGALTGRPLADAFSAMDIFVFVSLTETQGLVVSEAQAAGLPVIALDAAGVHETVARGGGWLLPPRTTAAAFAEAIHAFKQLAQPERRMLCEQALKSAACYSPLKMVQPTEALYGKLVSEHLSNVRRGALRKRIATEVKLLKSLVSPFETVGSP